MHSHVAEAEDLTREDILEHEDQQVLHKLEVQQDMDAEAGPIVPPGEPSIPYNHTTSAANLLEWPGTRKMVSYLDEDVQKYLSQFPLRQEERRGVLRLYGRGEGRDTVESPPADQVDESGVVSDLTDDSSDVLASSPGDVWGVLGANSPPTVSGQDRAGVTGPSDGTVDYSDHVIWKYVESFQKNIMEMHPIIHHAELRALVRDFQRSLIPRTKTGSTVAKFATGADVAADLTSTGQKRKRSPTLGPVDGQEVPPTPRFQRPARTMRTALVLLVLALGKLSLHKEKLPYVSEHPIRESFKRNGRPASPMHMGSSPPPHVSPRDGGHPERPGTGSRRSSLHGAGSGIKAQVRSRKNTELIPGLEYFALATDIIGNQLGGTSLKHVIALILAGLFHGQIGRVVESHRYIHMASVIILTIMRPSLDRLRRMFHENEAPASHRDNNHLFAFWTCLQLERYVVIFIFMG